MNDFSISVTDILGICGFITAIWGVLKIYREVKKPNVELRQRVGVMERKIEELERSASKDQEGDRIILECLSALINHEIDGNGIEGMKKMRSKLQDYLIEK